MSKITTLAVSNDIEMLSFAYFEGDILKDCGKILLNNLADMHKILYDFARTYKLGYIVVEAIDLENCKRRTALKLMRVRTILKLICEQQGIVYATPSTNGWEKYYFGDRIQGKKLWQEKVRIVNEVYGLDLVYDEKEIEKQEQYVADAIIMGSAFTQNQFKKSKEGYYGV
jgi:hypothetical protein